MDLEKIDNDMSESYEGLPAISWGAMGGDDLNEGERAEYAFYRKGMKKGTTRVLDLTCGTGKFLIHYVREGCCVDGVDSSPTMIENCRKRLIKEGLSANLYCQKMQDLELPEKYGVIFISGGSFVHLTKFADALETLRRCFEHLLPGGHLYVTLFFPAEARDPKAQTGYSISGPDPLDDGTTVEVERWTESVDHWNQVVVQKRRYTQRRGEEILKQELHLSSMRWFGKEEFILMLEKAGFRDIRLFANYSEEEPKEWETVLFRGAR